MKLKYLNFPLNLDTKDIEENGEFKGYGSVFKTIDSYNEVVAKGAFLESLKKHKSRGSMPKLLWQHRAAEPIGVYSKMSEDDTGLYVEGKLLLDLRQAREAHTLLKAKAIEGLSIGFVPKKWEDDSDTGVRTLTKLDLWEVSVVTFPANEDAQVEAVRAAIGDKDFDIRDCELILRDAGFSLKEAKALLSKGFSGIAHRDDDSERLRDVVEKEDATEIANILESNIRRYKNV